MEKNDHISAEEIERIFGRKDNSGIPYILCHRNEPVELTYELQDTTWEGLEPVEKHGRIQFEVYHDFVLRIGINGKCRVQEYCLIPDTKNNRMRLERISAPTKVLVKHRRYDVNTGKWMEKEVEEVEKPQYEIVKRADVSELSKQALIQEIFGNLDQDQLDAIIAAVRKGKEKVVQAPTTAGAVSAMPTNTESPAVAPLPGRVPGTKRGGRPRAEVPAAA